MDKPKLLSGDELVARGVLKLDSSLPDVGLKDVVPNGSWLEQKQIQSALEARKHLIEVERIEKRGNISLAEWREDLMLAEVTQKVGGHWQFYGHNIGKQLFLQPEEALLLMELNSLQLKHNDVTVSLQQAYALLLRTEKSKMEYKVYASLSRLGYKVYRFKKEIQTKDGKIDITQDRKDANNRKKDEVCENNKTDSSNEMDSVKLSLCQNINGNEQKEIEVNKEDNEKIENTTKENNDTEMTDVVSSTMDETNINEQHSKPTDVNARVENIEVENINSKQEFDNNKSGIVTLEDNITITDSTNSLEDTVTDIGQHRLLSLERRKVKPFNAKLTEKCFEKLPDFNQNQIATVSAPQEEYIPKNIYINHVSYVLNLESVRNNTKNTRDSEERPYSANEEANGDHVPRIRENPASNHASFASPPPLTNRFRPSFQYRPNFQFRPNYWRPNNMHYSQFNFMFQRVFVPPMTFFPRFRSYPSRPPLIDMFPRFPNFSQTFGQENNPRKRKRNNARENHLQAIKQLAGRLKLLIQSGNTQKENIESLQRLINTFNARYSMRLRLTESFEVVNDETIVETIALDDDEETNKKRRKTEENRNYTENFKILKQLALKLKVLEASDEVNSRHRRAFSNLVKCFNKSYNADVYMNDKYEVIDRKLITLDSSSDSDCVIEETPKAPKGKKLKNPFSILKQLSEKRVFPINKTNNSAMLNSEVTNGQEADDTKYSGAIKDCFGSWLPSEDDFGRAEVLSKHLTNTYLIDSKQDEYIYEFSKSQSCDFDNWLDIKISFLKSIDETKRIIQSEMSENTTYTLISPEDCTDMPSVLKKLSVIKANKDCEGETSLKIDFDVYRRDVQNFKKTNRPLPHFRVICLSESSGFPIGKDIAYLHSKFGDNICIVFAIVGTSVAYLQINPTDIPVYIPNNDESYLS